MGKQGMNTEFWVCNRLEIGHLEARRNELVLRMI